MIPILAAHFVRCGSTSHPQADFEGPIAQIFLAPFPFQFEPDKPIVNFEERSSDAPPAVKALYFPGDTYGLQFVYPQDRAAQLARRTGQNVLSMRNDMTQNMAAPASSANGPSIQHLENTEVTGVDPSGNPVAVVIIVGSKPQK